MDLKAFVEAHNKPVAASSAPAASAPRATGESRLTAFVRAHEAPAKEPSQVEAALRGGFQGLTIDWGDEITAGLEAAFTTKSYEDAVRENRAANKAAKDAFPKTYAASEIGGAIAGGLATGGSGVAARVGLTGVKGAMALGALTGAAQNVGAAEDISLSDALTGAATGAAFGGLAGAATGRYIDTAPARAAAMKAGGEKAGWAIPGASILLGAHDLATGGATYVAAKGGKALHRAATNKLADMQARSWATGTGLLDAIRGGLPVGVAEGAEQTKDFVIEDILGNRD